jgi:hypothetical protein
LVLSLRTGLSSPQFQVKHDDLFKTTRHRKGSFRMPKSHWQALSGFTKSQTTVSTANQEEDQRAERKQRAGRNLRGGTTIDSKIDQASADVDEGNGIAGEVESIGEEDKAPDDPSNKSATINHGEPNQANEIEPLLPLQQTPQPHS